MRADSWNRYTSACCACAAAYRHDTDHVGQQFSVTRERIRQIEAKAPRKLKLKAAQAFGPAALMGLGAP
jgi:hypothetical protein